MEIVKIIIDAVYNILTIEINLFGYAISMWNLFIYTALLSILVYFLFKMLD